MKIVFLLGVPRSGTTLITNHLTHFDNTCFLPRSLRLLEKIGLGCWCGLAKLMARFSGCFPSLGLRWHQHDGGEIFWKRFEATQGPEKRRKLLEKAVYPDASNSRVFINKRIANVNLLDILIKTFPEATLLHIKRNPLDTVQSILSRRKKNFGTMNKRWGVFVPDMPEQYSDPVIDCSIQYMKIYEKIEDYMSFFSASQTVAYEDYCEHPGMSLESLSQKIGLVGALPDTQNIASRNREHRPEFAKSVLNTLGQTQSITLANTVTALKALYEV